MADLILHHYPTSPFAEKARLMLGYKKLSWKSVMIPVVMPKPDLTALTGDLHGCAAGDRVSITPTDTGHDPVEGELVLSAPDEIAVRRNDPRAGNVVVHFPRIGFQMKKLVQV